MTTATADESTVAIPWWVVLLQGIAALVIGVLLLMRPGATMVVLVQLLGIYWLIQGIFQIVAIFVDSSMWGWKLFVGILGILAGIYVMQSALGATVVVGATLVIILGIQGIIVGTVNLIQAFQGAGWGVGILGVLSIIFGLILLFNTLLAAATLPWVLGIFGIVGGITSIFMAFKLR